MSNVQKSTVMPEERKGSRRIENSTELQILSAKKTVRFSMLIKGLIIFTMYGMNNMKMYIKYFLLSFYSQHVTVLLSIMFSGSIEGEVTL
jgi:hypothetical protein